MNNKQKLKLAPFVVKRYEPKLNKYYFYNAKKQTFWESNFLDGSVVSALDGTLSAKEVCMVLFENNPNIELSLIESNFYNIFEHLINEEFIYAY